MDARIFWLSFFKSRAAVTSDDFLNALEQLAQMQKNPHLYIAKKFEYQKPACDKDYLVSLDQHGNYICECVAHIVGSESFAIGGIDVPQNFNQSAEYSGE